MKRWTIVIVALAGIMGAVVGNAQRATERFIPIGQSPGLSGRYTSIGTVEAVDPGTYTITIVEGTGTRVVGCNKDTSFWVDRSKRRQVNLVGALVDCRSGARVEIKYVGNDKEAALAEWVKIEVTSSE